MLDSMVHDGLSDAFGDIHMGITAENVAEDYGITREQQDEFAAKSQQKAERADRATGVFKDEIVPVEVPQKKGGPRLVDSDEHPRPGTTDRGAGQAAPGVPQGGGTVTAGNASGINDGAAALVVMSQRMAAASAASSRSGTIESYASVGVEPRDHGHRPDPGDAQGAREGRPRASTTSTCSSSTRRSRRSRSPSAASSASRRSASTSTAARSRSATRSGPAAGASSSRCCTR